jgi:hypothetical protein
LYRDVVANLGGIDRGVDQLQLGDFFAALPRAFGGWRDQGVVVAVFDAQLLFELDNHALDELAIGIHESRFEQKAAIALQCAFFVAQLLVGTTDIEQDGRRGTQRKRFFQLDNRFFVFASAIELAAFVEVLLGGRILIRLIGVLRKSRLRATERHQNQQHQKVSTHTFFQFGACVAKSQPAWNATQPSRP